MLAGVAMVHHVHVYVGRCDMHVNVTAGVVMVHHVHVYVGRCTDMHVTAGVARDAWLHGIVTTVLVCVHVYVYIYSIYKYVYIYIYI
jgi:hypothetical protein